MASSIYAITVGSFAPMLRSLSALLDKAAQYAKSNNLAPTTLPEARLAPDMYPLIKQVQLACDHAKDTAARLMSKDPPRFDDNERTLDQLKQRVARTLDYLESPSEAAFAGAEDRRFSIPLLDNLVLEVTGLQLLRDWALPHFYFHVVTAYDILRHSGVDVGKRDYLGQVGSYIRQRKP